MKPQISIIIPTLNEEESLGETLASLRNFKTVEIIVADGGSRDRTVSIAESFGARVLHSPRGRGAQLRCGAAAANGEILWFLHADTRPPPDSISQMIEALRNPEIIGGNFAIRFDGERAAAEFLTWLYPQLRKIGLIYGDSAIFARAEIYRKTGGFKPFPIFEDLDFVERLKREGALVTLPATVTTSSRRFENKSFALIFLRWTILQILYWLGVSPENLLKIYFPDPKYKKT